VRKHDARAVGQVIRPVFLDLRLRQHNLHRAFFTALFFLGPALACGFFVMVRYVAAFFVAA
jgi:hypothetical protein